MKLYLVRHGEASPTFSTVDPCLSQHGQMQAQRVGLALRAGNVHLTRIITSGYARANETAQIIRDTLECTCPLEEDRHFSPSGEIDEMRVLLEASPEGEVLVVGHLMSIDYLARDLGYTGMQHFANCTMATFEFVNGHWTFGTWCRNEELELC